MCFACVLVIRDFTPPPPVPRGRKVLCLCIVFLVEVLLSEKGVYLLFSPHSDSGTSWKPLSTVTTKGTTKIRQKNTYNNIPYCL